MALSIDAIGALRAEAARTMPIKWRSYATGASFNTDDGILTINMAKSADVTVDLDGRYGIGGGSVRALRALYLIMLQQEQPLQVKLHYMWTKVMQKLE